MKTFMALLQLAARNRRWSDRYLLHQQLLHLERAELRLTVTCMEASAADTAAVVSATAGFSPFDTCCMRS